MLDARDRHQRQIEEKIRLAEIRQQEEEERRLHNEALRHLSLEKKRRNNDNIHSMNQRTRKFVVQREQEGY